MAYIGIIVLLLVSWIVARSYRSSNVWWIYVFTIMLGLLVGVVGKNLVVSNNTTKVACSYNTDDNDDYSTNMQSLVAAVTEGTTIAIQGLQVISMSNNNHLSGALYEQYLARGRDQPEIKDSS